MSTFLDTIKSRAKQYKKKIVLPESMDRRTFEAAEKILKEDIADIIIIGTPEEVEKYSEGYDITGATIIDPFTYEKTEEYLNLFVELLIKNNTYNKCNYLTDNGSNCSTLCLKTREGTYTKNEKRVKNALHNSYAIIT